MLLSDPVCLMPAVQITGERHKEAGTQDSSDRRDAATSVGGLITTPRQPLQQQQHLPASSLCSAADHPPGDAAAPGGAAVSTASSSGAGEADGAGKSGGEQCRSSSSRYGGGGAAGATDAASSMDKLHALYARFISDSHTPQRRFTVDGVEQQAGGSSTGAVRQPRRTGGVGTAPVTAPMRSSMPYPLAAMAGTSPVEGSVGRRCRSVSPQKEPRRSHALSQNNLQQHQHQHHQQHCIGNHAQSCSNHRRDAAQQQPLHAV